jgi:putative hydrolase of the HAD superfamily
MIRVLSFDLDNTLHDFTAASRHALEIVRRRMLACSGAPDEALSLDVVIDDLLVTADAMERPYARIHALRIEAFTRTLARLGREDRALAEELSYLYLAHRFDACRLFDGAVSVLSALRASYRLCAVSNGEQDLGRLGLEGVFETVVFAEAAGVDKPDPRIFRLAMERMRCAPPEFVHVGDSLRTDVLGAQRAGARAVWYNPAGKAAPHGSAPDGEIRSLSDLPGLLADFEA